MNINELYKDIDFMCGSTSASYPLNEKVRNMNFALNDVARVIWESQGDWQYQDSNASALPFSTTNLTHNVKDITLPSTLQRLHTIEVMDSGGHYQKLRQIDLHDLSIATTEFLSSIGMPLYYDLEGRSIIFYPTPSSAYTTLTSGARVYFDGDAVALTTASTATIPGFAKQFHRILSYAATIDYTKDIDDRNLYIAQKTRLETGLTRFYGKRNVDRTGGIIPKAKKTARQYI